MLTYWRNNGACTCIDIADLESAKLKSINGKIYWHLVDQNSAFVFFCESVEGASKVRQYLSTWRGFDYDGLIHFNHEDDEILLWPLYETRLGKVA